jgi:cytoskeleton protein RodZ
MSSVGETLRRERLRTGLDLEKLSQETKISVRMLELIEAEQFDKLPGGVFARSFVRQYARAVGLDDEEVVRELDERLAPQPDPVPAPQDTAHHEIRVPRVASWPAGSRIRSNSTLPSLILVVMVMLACSLAYNWWQKRGRVTSAPRVHEMEAVVPAPAPPPASSTAPLSAQTEPVPPAAPADTASGASDQPAVHAEAVAALDPTGALRIALTAEEPTWVRATANGKVVFSGVIQPKETKALSASDTLTLRIGNAGGVSISLNGKEIPAVGPKGQVRVVQVSADGGVQVVPPPKPQPAQTL